jgi:hypothetical protein
MTEHAESEFQVTNWEEKPWDELEGGPRLTRARVTKVFQGELEGDGAVEYLMTHRPDGTAAFVGIERVKGRVGKRTGTFVLEHHGTFEAGVARATCRVVPGSGTGELAGLQGEGTFAAEGRAAPFRLEYELPG